MAVEMDRLSVTFASSSSHIQASQALELLKKYIPSIIDSEQ